MPQHASPCPGIPTCGTSCQRFSAHANACRSTPLPASKYTSCIVFAEPLQSQARGHTCAQVLNTLASSKG
eukprot:2554604-Alexandrium_andersonii.AAC.1